MLVAGQYQGSDDSDSEDDQFTDGNRDSIGNFLPQHEAAEAEEDSSNSDEDGATVAADDDAACSGHGIAECSVLCTLYSLSLQDGHCSAHFPNCCFWAELTARSACR